MFKNQISNLESEIKAMENELKGLDENSIFFNNNKKLVDKNKKQLDDLLKKQKFVNSLEGLTPKEIDKKVKESNIKLDSDFLSNLKKELSIVNLKESTNDFEIIDLKIQDRGVCRVGGYLLFNDIDYICVVYNHIAIKGTVINNRLEFIINDNHSQFYSNNNLKVFKSYLETIFNLFDMETKDYFNYKKVKTGKSLDIKCKDLINCLASHYLDLKSKEFKLKSEEIVLSENLTNAIESLQY